MSNIKNSKNPKEGCFIAYCHCKAERNHATFVITPNGSNYWLYKGSTYTEKEFDDMFPIQGINKSKYGLIGTASKYL